MNEDPIVATGIALTRNDAVLPFPHAAEGRALERFRDRAIAALERAARPGDWTVYRLEELPEARRAYFTEQGLMTPGFNDPRDEGRALAVYQDDQASVEINGDDHLHILGWRPGDHLSELWATVDGIDDALERDIAYAFDEHWGYLTAMPKDAGTGLRAHATVHIPALLVAGRLGSVTLQLASQHLALTPLWQGAGGLFQVSNHGSRGIPEVLSIQAVSEAAGRLTEKERSVRKTLLRENPVRVRDYIGRALGVAQQAWSVGVTEGLSLLSAVRVGVEMDIVEAPELSVDAVFSLMRRIQPGHLALEHPHLYGTMDEGRLDEARAALLRGLLARARTAS